MRRICDRELRRWFLRYRAKYFLSLPDNVDVFWSASADCYGQVEAIGDRLELQLNPKYAVDARMTRMTLLHEMAHLAIWPDRSHGAKFQAEMLRLASTGAFRALW